MKNTRALGTGVLALGLALGMTACGGDDKGSATNAATAAPSSAAPSSAAASPATFGPACSTLPKSGEGSLTGMADDPVATAASNNPALSTLVTAVKKAGLVDTLNTAPALTVFAPTNDAFAKLPKKDLDAVLADKKKLTDILTYHVVAGKQAPTALENGNFKTLQGGMVKTSGSGEEYKANDANVVCGNVPTGNATVYIIDTVMMPKM